MSYTYDKNDTTSLVKEGDYEAIIERIERRTLPTGKEKLSVMYRIRSDVEQPYKNKCMFEDIWEEKENPGKFNHVRINQLLGTQEIEDGHSFETINDVIDFLLNGYLIIHVCIDFDTYKGEDVNIVSFYKSSKAKPQKLGEIPQQPEPVAEAGAEVPQPDGIVGDDLPF